MKSPIRKTGTSKPRMTEERFNQAKGLFKHGLSAGMVADLAGMHHSTACRIRRCSSFAEYQASNRAKATRQQELEDTRNGVTTFTSDIPTSSIPLTVNSGNAVDTGTTTKTGVEFIRAVEDAVNIKTPEPEFTGNIYIAGESFWTFHHAASAFNVSYGTIKKLVEVNKITCNKVGHRYFIPVSSLRDYLTSTD